MYLYSDSPSTRGSSARGRLSKLSRLEYPYLRARALGLLLKESRLARRVSLSCAFDLDIIKYLLSRSFPFYTCDTAVIMAPMKRKSTEDDSNLRQDSVSFAPGLCLQHDTDS